MLKIPDGVSCPFAPEEITAAHQITPSLSTAYAAPSAPFSLREATI